MNKESNIEERRYGLISRDTLRPPSRYASQDQLQIQGQVKDKVKTLKRERAGKKGSITRKTMQIKQLIEKSGSRTKLKFQQESLMMVKREAENLHEKLM